MRMIHVTEAVGTVLSHDITKIVPSEFKGRAFKKGHIIRSEDVDELLRIGKENIYVWELKEGEIHENDAAYRLANGEKLAKQDLLELAHGGLCLQCTECRYPICPLGKA